MSNIKIAVEIWMFIVYLLVAIYIRQIQSKQIYKLVTYILDFQSIVQLMPFYFYILQPGDAT